MHIRDNLTLESVKYTVDNCTQETFFKWKSKIAHDKICSINLSFFLFINFIIINLIIALNKCFIPTSICI